MTRSGRPGANSLVRIRDERWCVEGSFPYAECVVVDVIGAEGDNLGRRASFVLPFELWDELPSTTRPLRVSSRGWRRLVRGVLSRTSPALLALRSGVGARFALMPFQLEPALAYLRGEASRFLIADAVGLGKTVQAGLIVAEMLARRREGRALIVVPSGLREQWREELMQRFHIAAEILDASSLRQASAALPAGVNPWLSSAAIITSIDYVKRPEVLRSLEPVVWDVIVFDEAHTLGGRSDRAAAAGGLAARGRAVALLTATPHSGDQEAFARLCRIGDVGNRFPLTVFRRTRAELGVAGPRRTTWLRLRASRTDRRLHDALTSYARLVWTRGMTPGARLAMLVLLKRGASSATALTRSLARRRALLAAHAPAADLQLLLPLADDDGEPYSELAAPGLADRDDELRMLDDLIAMGHMEPAVPRKITAVRRLLRGGREAAVVFTQYRDTLEELAETLSDTAAATIHGGMTTRERLQSVSALNRGKARVLLATDAASEGLNLQAVCRLVVSFDLPWTPLRLEQRAGRVDRIGQTRRVHACQLIAGGTYEEVVAARVRERTEIARAAVDDFESGDEAATAGVVLGGIAPDSTPQRTSCIPLTPSPELAALARAESNRIASARLLAHQSSATAPARPFYARPLRQPTRGVLVGYRVTHSDPRSLHTWDSVVGITGHMVPGAHPEVGSILGSSELVDLVRESIERWTAAERRLWRLMVARALVRDRAIAGALRTRQAHLAAALVQPDLFSLRLERTLTPQIQVLQESLEQLRHSSAETRALGHLRLATVTPLFALMAQR